MDEVVQDSNDRNLESHLILATRILSPCMMLRLEFPTERKGFDSRMVPPRGRQTAPLQWPINMHVHMVCARYTLLPSNYPCNRFRPGKAEQGRPEA
jgi:hypothetical protein